jgi:predicted transcriptional regulator
MVLRWRVVKRVPLTVVQGKMKELEEKYGGPLFMLHDDFVSGGLTSEMLDDYIEWSSMNHALMAYREGEDYEYFAEFELELMPEEYEKLTPKRLELLDEIAKESVDSINALAGKVGRDVKNVYNDLKHLEHLGFIRLVREGIRLRPEVLVEEITILLA